MLPAVRGCDQVTSYFQEQDVRVAVQMVFRECHAWQDAGCPLDQEQFLWFICGGVQPSGTPLHCRM